MRNMFPLAQIQTSIPLPNGYCTHVRDRFLSQGQISNPITYILIRGSESESKPMEKSCKVQESVSASESQSDSSNGNKPLHEAKLSKQNRKTAKDDLKQEIRLTYRNNSI